MIKVLGPSRQMYVNLHVEGKPDTSIPGKGLSGTAMTYLLLPLLEYVVIILYIIALTFSVEETGRGTLLLKGIDKV